MDKTIIESVAILDAIFPDRPAFMNHVEVIHPEIARYAEMHMNSRINTRCVTIPWEEIYTLVLDKTIAQSELFDQVRNAIVNSNSN